MALESLNGATKGGNKLAQYLALAAVVGTAVQGYLGQTQGESHSTVIATEKLKAEYDRAELRRLLEELANDMDEQDEHVTALRTSLASLKTAVDLLGKGQRTAAREHAQHFVLPEPRVGTAPRKEWLRLPQAAPDRESIQAAKEEMFE